MGVRKSMRKSFVSRSWDVILPLYLALGRLHLECSIQPGFLSKETHEAPGAGMGGEQG